MTESWVWQELGIRRIVNAAGKMTYLGSATLSPKVLARMGAAAIEPVEMADLKLRAGASAARAIGAEAAIIVASAAAGLAQATAAAIVGDKIAAIESVPHVATLRRKVVMQAAHAVNFGAPLAQMARMGGGHVTMAGSANRCTPAHLAEAIDESTAALLFVISHHVQAESQVSLAAAVVMAHAAGIPVIVCAAAETDLQGYVQSGADLIVFSGHKAIGGPTSGLVAGRADLVAAVAAQEAGIGRAMKTSKETIAGFLAALEAYVAHTSDEDLRARLAIVRTAAGDHLPARFVIVEDPTRPIPRLIVEVLPDAGLDARALVERLEAGDPSIRTRNHEVDRGRVAIDPRELTDDGAREVGEAIRANLLKKETLA